MTDNVFSINDKYISCIGVISNYILMHNKNEQIVFVFIEKHTESTFVEISIKNGTPVVIGSLYRTPNTPAEEFIDNVSNVIKKIRCEGKNKEVILRMDHNLDLLHSDIHIPNS